MDGNALLASMLCWYICIGPEKGTLGESGLARFVIGSLLTR